MNMDAYLAVTGHYISDSKLSAVVLGVLKFPETHTAEYIKELQEIVSCLITDHASNMILKFDTSHASRTL